MLRRLFLLSLAVALVAGACTQGDDAASEETTSTASTVETTTVAPTTTAATTTTTAPTTTAGEQPEADPAPVIDGAGLGEPGPYGVGMAQFETIDGSREDRPVRVLVFYPAVTDSDSPDRDAKGDATRAPYPAIVGDGKIGWIIGPHLASHGFVFAAVQGQDTWGMTLDTNMIDYPLDHMAALDALEILEDSPAAGLADTGRAGTIGYSFGAWDALMLTGARIDPDHYEQTCTSRPDGWSDSWWAYICGSVNHWDRLVERAEQVGIATSEGLWEPIGDERIKAAMPMGPEGYDLTGPDGLAEATAAVLLVGAGADTLNDYHPATTDLFEHYPEAELITFVGADHFMIFQPDAVAQMRRFATAFFGYHLSGEDGYARYVSKEFVEHEAPAMGETNSFETLVWGVPQD